MSVRKLKADQLFTGRTLVDGKVLICTVDGEVLDVVDESLAGDDVEEFAGLLTPGFVNCHCHIELSHMHGLIPEHTGLVDFVFSVVTQRHFNHDEIAEAIASAETAMIANGIVAVGDICNTLFSLPQKKKGLLYYYNFIETSGWLPEVAEARFSRNAAYLQAFSETMDASLVPHAPYSVSDDLWTLLGAGFHGKVITIHNQETAFEDEFFTSNTGDLVRMYGKMNLDTSFYRPSGKSSLQTFFGKLATAARVILVHNTFTKQADLDFISEQRTGDTVSFCLCVNANLYIEQSLPPVQMFRDNRCRIVLGTDSLASSSSLSIWNEVQTILKYFPDAGLAEVLQWATLNGAEALGVDTRFGSFDKGKRPGVVLLPTNRENSLMDAIPVKLM